MSRSLPTMQCLGLPWGSSRTHGAGEQRGSRQGLQGEAENVHMYWGRKTKAGIKAGLQAAKGRVGAISLPPKGFH